MTASETLDSCNHYTRSDVALYCLSRTMTPSLTTTFTPPASCFGPVFTFAETTTPQMPRIYDNASDVITGLQRTTDMWPTSTVSIYTYAPGANLTAVLSRGVDPVCFPSPFWPIARSTSSLNEKMEHFYSPGICPYGYTTALASFAGIMVTGTCCPESMGPLQIPAAK